MTRNTVVIVGSGLMGSGIAAVSALAGNPTILVDVELERAQRGKDNAAAHIEELIENGLAPGAELTEAGGRITASADLAAACESAKLVIEAIVEQLPLKQEMFATLDALLPEEVPILSNTSGLRITEIAEQMQHPERAVTAHFWFPAYLVPLVEVVVGDKTELSVAESVRDILASWGKKAVLVKRDLPGQLANRILQAVIRESVNIVQMGLASPEDVDTAVKCGMGIRFPVWGPLEHIDAVGLDLCSSVQDTVLPGIDSRTDCNPLMKDLVAQGDLGYKTGKGIYDWSQKDMKALEEKRNRFIIHALKVI